MSLHLLFVFMVSGTIVTLATLAAEKLKNPVLAGLIIMFPSLTLLSIYFIAKAEGTQVAANVIFGALLTLPAWIAYALALYHFLYEGDLNQAVIYSILVFIITGGLFLFFKSRFGPI